jgi:hypothetical protein
MTERNDEDQQEASGGQHPRNIKESEEQGSGQGQVGGSQRVGQGTPAGSGGAGGQGGGSQGGGGQGNLQGGRGQES